MMKLQGNLIPYIAASMLLIAVDLTLAGPGIGEPVRKAQALSEASSSLEERISRFLKNSDRMQGAAVDIQVRDHIAIVTGTVDNLDQAEWIAATCFATDEVYGAVQRIEIDASRYDQSTAQESLQHMLNHSPALEATELVVTAAETPEVMITGEAGDPDEIEFARELASRIPGVRAIRVNATIDPLRFRSDEAIEAQLGFMLLDDPLTAHFPVRFLVTDGLLSIEGKVGSSDAKRYLAEKFMVSGIRNVDLSGIETDRDLNLPGMSDKGYFPSDGLRVLEMACDMDARLAELDREFREDAGRIFVEAPRITRSEAEAIMENARGLPGIRGVFLPAPTDGNKVLSQR
ncbi:BON domain-containing protein [Haloferula rosea]|uniref:BON domain-containing protein n=1 Tax=Haloferula rosea TaxID=490093 RepID=A0A934R5F5_9BACT|nr:BON domain-containing protein [Haloferula rosea]MBK1825644.1 BON domain-containing protein [Haloferula rosea]